MERLEHKVTTNCIKIGDAKTENSATERNTYAKKRCTYESNEKRLKGRERNYAKTVKDWKREVRSRKDN